MNLKECHLLVTPTSYGKNDPRLKIELEAEVGKVTYNPTGKPLTSDEVARLLPGVDGYIAGLDVIDAQAMGAADRLKVIARYGVGFDNVNLDFAREKGIVVTNTPGANSVSVAELALGLMLALARQIPEAVEAVHQGKWPRFSGFDCRVQAFDTIPDTAFAREYRVELTSQAAVVEQADFLSLHVPLLAETRCMVNDSFLGSMKKGSFLINTSRGELVDEEALLRALQSGHLRGAGLDAFAVEPPAAENPLLALPQVIATPHLGAQTDGATSNMGWSAMRDCLAVLKDQEPAFRVA